MNRVTIPSGLYFAAALAFLLSLKLLLAYYIPITADEAYYAIWGTYLSGGGYDHPPMIGFLLYPLIQLGHHALILRLPAVLSSFILGVSAYLYLKSRRSTGIALSASLLLTIAPISFFNIIITTDTPLFIFSFLSVICVLQALKKEDDWRWFSLGGLFLGCAFFSKYFAALLAISYATYLLFIAPNRRRVLGLILLALFSLPFVIQNLYWNYQHAWSNILFNFYNRNHDMQFGYKTILAYSLILLYLTTPPLLLSLFSFPKKELVKQPLFYFFAVPLTLLLGLSCFKSIGLHWPLSFVVLIYLWAGEYLHQKRLKELFRFTCYWIGIQFILIFILLSIPIHSLHKLPISDRAYSKIAYFFIHEKTNRFLSRHYDSKGYLFASPNYANASLFFYDTSHYASVFLKGSYHGRQDDFITDFKRLDHKDFVIFSSTPFSIADYQPFFEKIEAHRFKVNQAHFYYLLGNKFNYLIYRERILRSIDHAYWQIPHYLPHAPSFFHLKYFKD